MSYREWLETKKKDEIVDIAVTSNERIVKKAAEIRELEEKLKKYEKYEAIVTNVDIINDIAKTRDLVNELKTLVKTKDLVNELKTLVKTKDLVAQNDVTYQAIATHIYKKYEALREAGFTEEQAMQLLPMWLDD